MDRLIAEVSDRLRLLDARLDEAVTRAIELSVRADNPDELSGLGDDIDALVGDMESLRQGLDEVDATSAGGRGVSSLPALGPDDRPHTPSLLPEVEPPAGTEEPGVAEPTTFPPPPPPPPPRRTP